MLSYLSLLKPNTKNPKKNMPLQALTSGNSNIGKRVYLEASLTIEAALGLPLILFSIILLLFPLRIMEADRKMQMAAESVATDVSKYMFTVKELKKEKKEKIDAESEAEETGENLQEYLSIGSDVALGAFAAKRAEDEVADEGMSIVSFLGSEFMRDNDMILVKLDYEYKLPFPVLRVGSLTQEVVASRRAWTGKKGSSESGGGEGSIDEEDEIVYIGKNSTRYHMSPTCHYLSNNWSELIVGKDGKADGRKPCDRCGKGAKPGQVVYVTPQGDKYHTDTGCSAMQAYPQAVKKSEVEWMGCCSYCGGK